MPGHRRPRVQLLTGPPATGAGSSLERLAALSDGIFAVVMTLLVLLQLNSAIAPRIRPLDRF